VSESLFVIVYIVLPKIRRVLSGKIVVVSHLLRETATLPGFGYSPGKHPNAEGPSSGEEGFITTSNGKDGTEEPVKLAMKRDDPLPVEVETEMYILDEVIGSLKDKWYVNCASSCCLFAADLSNQASHSDRLVCLVMRSTQTSSRP
jgi:hypothetical protein